MVTVNNYTYRGPRNKSNMMQETRYKDTGDTGVKHTGAKNLKFTGYPDDDSCFENKDVSKHNIYMLPTIGFENNIDDTDSYKILPDLA